MTPLPAPKIDSFNAHDVNLGETWLWQVTNLSHGDHPFHLHGFFFRPLEYEFQDDLVPANNFTYEFSRRMLKDTIRVPARGNLKGSTRTITRLLTHFDDAGRGRAAVAQGQTPTFDAHGDWTSGGWLFHCHVLEHSGKGMLSFYEVHEAGDVSALLGKSLPGTNGKASLTTRGKLAPGTPLRLDLVGALPNTAVILAIGLQPLRFPFRGGELVPSPDFLLNGVTDLAGAKTWSTLGWQGYPSGTQFYAQVGFLDSGASQGLALSNAVRVTRP